MKSPMLALAGLIAAATHVSAQECQATAFDLVLGVEPAVAASGEIIQLSLTNTSTSCTYQLHSTCLSDEVHVGDCNGDKFPVLTCQPGPTVIPPGETFLWEWDQTIGQGVQVSDGQYAFPVLAHADSGVGTGATVQLCAFVQIGTGCGDPFAYGVGSVGTDHFVPSLSTLGGPPALGNESFGVAVTSGLGGAPSLVLASLDSAAIDPVLVDPTKLVLIAPLALSPGGPGQGIGILDLPVPTDPALLGLPLFFQAVIADPEGDGGLAFTDAAGAVVCE